MYLVGDMCKLVYRSDEDVLSLWEYLDNSRANVLCHLEYVGTWLVGGATGVISRMSFII